MPVNEVLNFYYLSQSSHAQIVAQAQAGFPYEICGFLGGIALEYGQVIRPATNIATQPQVAYNIAPEETLAALLAWERSGYKITGIYHSHPNYPAVPSNTDLKLADLADVCYLIISVRGKAAQAPLHFELRAYRIVAKKAYEVPIKITED
jgi:proteasome lid subunit RPN8/RPN11